MNGPVSEEHVRTARVHAAYDVPPTRPVIETPVGVAHVIRREHHTEPLRGGAAGVAHPCRAGMPPSVTFGDEHRHAGAVEDLGRLTRAVPINNRLAGHVVALAQLDKVDSVVESRIKTAETLTDMIQGVPGVSTQKITPDSKHVYWKYPLRIDDDVIEGGVDSFAAELKERGIFSAPRYIQKPAFMCQIFQERNTFGKLLIEYNVS